MSASVLRRSGAANDKVDFVIAGTQKGGTTALYWYLRTHPELCMAAQKEVHYFDTEAQFAVEQPDYAVYRAQFTPTGSQRLLGDATPIYMYWEPAPARIHRYNPAMKFIVMLRNPITRAFSHWNMAQKLRWDPLPFEDALRAESKRREEALPLQDRRLSYVDRGFYCAQLERIWALFPVEQTLVFKSEDLRNDPQGTLARVTDFLGVERLGAVEAKEISTRKYDRAMTAAERNYLVGVFEAEIHELERMLGWDCSDWLTAPASA